MTKTMTPLRAIKTFFEQDGGRKLGIEELKQLTTEDKAELAKLAAMELSVELVAAS